MRTPRPRRTTRSWHRSTSAGGRSTSRARAGAEASSTTRRASRGHRPPPVLSKHLALPDARDMIPAELRPSGATSPYARGCEHDDERGQHDEFVVDPAASRSRSGAPASRRHVQAEHLMDRYGVQINKTTRNTSSS